MTHIVIVMPLIFIPASLRSKHVAANKKTNPPAGDLVKLITNNPIKIRMTQQPSYAASLESITPYQ
jgi:hypothetical protein